MTLHETIKEQIKDAMRAHEELRLEVLRGLQAAFSNELIARKSAAPLLKDEEVLALIKKAVKQRKDSIEQFEKGGRKDLATKEKKELEILVKYLPETMSRADIKKIVEAKLKKEGPIDPKKMGQFMGGIMKELKGKAEGEDVKAVLDEMTK
jgi:uncharacterized protein YqeY